MYVPTLREAPKDAVAASHKWLTRAGCIHLHAAGVYALLPLGLRALDKIDAIVAAELGAAGCVRLDLPLLSRADLWQTSGRWAETGDELFTLEDRHGRAFCLAPTHEEVITRLVAETVDSPRALPLRLYQIGRKYRDEMRPRGGLLRGREFMMKDLYTFDVDAEGAFAAYEDITTAYQRIFKRLGLESVRADADPGNIGGSMSHEFHVVADTGEDLLLTCGACGSSANREKAAGLPPMGDSGVANGLAGGGPTALEEVFRGGDLILPEHLSVSAFRMGDGACVHVVHRAADTVNPLRVVAAISATAASSAAAAGMAAGMSPPAAVGPAEEIAAQEPRTIHDYPMMVDLACGSVVLHHAGSSATEELIPADLRYAAEGDTCGVCQEAALEEHRGIELGHSFYLGTKYSAPFKAEVTVGDRGRVPLEMGCYGLGMTRILAAIVETHCNENGILWPMTVAPHIATVLYADDHAAAAESFASSLVDALGPHVADEIVLDDRAHVNLGEKLKEAAMVGFPYVFVLGREFGRTGRVELLIREGVEPPAAAAAAGERTVVAEPGALAAVAKDMDWGLGV